jgi:hypothetical protein
MRHRYKVTGPHGGSTYPEYEIVDERGYTVAYVHDAKLAEIMAAAINKKQRNKAEQ